MIHILRRKTLAISKPQQPVIGSRAPRQLINRGVSDHDPQFVCAHMEKRPDVQRERRVPHRSHELTVDINHGCVAHGWVEPRPHAWEVHCSALDRRALAEIQNRDAGVRNVFRDVDCSNVSRRARVILARGIVGPGMQCPHRFADSRFVQSELPVATQIDGRKIRICNCCIIRSGVVGEHHDARFIGSERHAQRRSAARAGDFPAERIPPLSAPLLRAERRRETVRAVVRVRHEINIRIRQLATDEAHFRRRRIERHVRLQIAADRRTEIGRFLHQHRILRIRREQFTRNLLNPGSVPRTFHESWRA